MKSLYICIIIVIRYLKNISQRWPVRWMAPTYSIGQEMVSVFFAIKTRATEVSCSQGICLTPSHIISD